MDLCTKDCLKHHNQIIDLSDNVEDQFNKMVLVQFLGSTIIFCFSLFQLSFVSNILSYYFYISLHCEATQMKN